MPDQALFDGGPRTDPRPHRGGETIYRFLNRVDQPYYEAIRTLLNSWFARFPNGAAKQDLGGRLRSNDINHRSAYWELWLHEFMLCTGFDVTIHPSSPDGRRRDFLVARDGSAFYVEAHCLFDPQQVRGEALRLAQFRTNLADRIRLPRHTLMLKVGKIGAAQLSARRFAAMVTDAATNTSPGDTKVAFEERTPDGWELTGYISGLPEGAPSIPLTEINLMRGHVGTVEAMHISPLRRALETKAREASALDLPYVVAINLCQQTHNLMRPIDIHQALVGTETVLVGSTAEVGYRRNDDGSFGTSTSLRMTSVSAALVAKDVAPDFCARQLPTAYLHPGPARPLVHDLGLPLAARSGDPSQPPEIAPARAAAHEVFGLDPDWPGVEAFAKPYW